MEKNELVILLVALCTSFSTSVFAETIILKSGSTVEGKIIEKTDKYLKIDFQGVVLTYASDEIERIDEKNKINLTSSDEIERIDEKNKINSTPSEINKAYYAPVQQGLKEFRCEVTSSSFEQIKGTYNLKSPATDLENKVLNSIKFYLTYDPSVKYSRRFSFDSTPFDPTGNAEFDSMVQQAINNVRDLTVDPRESNGFCSIWLNIINCRFWEIDTKYAIEKLPDGYCISYKSEEELAKVFTDNNFIISEMIINDENEGITRRKLDFMSSNQGFLLQRYEEVSDNASRKYVVTIDYQEVEGFQMPKLVLIQDTKLGSTQSFKLNFLNFEIKK